MPSLGVAAIADKARELLLQVPAEGRVAAMRQAARMMAGNDMLPGWLPRIDAEDVEDFIQDAFIDNPAVSSWAALHPWLPGVGGAETIEELAACIGWSTWDESPMRSSSEAPAAPHVGDLEAAASGLRDIFEPTTPSPSPASTSDVRASAQWPEEIIGPCVTGEWERDLDGPKRGFVDRLLAALRRLAG